MMGFCVASTSSAHVLYLHIFFSSVSHLRLTFVEINVILSFFLQVLSVLMSRRTYTIMMTDHIADKYVAC
jgi:hypothetical protein